MKDGGMGHELLHEVEALLYREADLLDERRLHEWLELFTDDLHYWMPVRETLGDAPYEREFATRGEMAYFDDTKHTLTMRVERLDIGTAWAEMPPSRSRHLITNIQVRRTEGDEIEVTSNFFVYRSRLERDEDTYVGTRRDVLRRVDSQLKIARRTILLDQAVLSARNISVFL
jgi:3-phenylpropionate/cinnamic acid dioxygenase small subunit